MRIKKCKSCFRFTEDWRDARQKGLEEIYDGFGSYAKKPRAGIKLKCVGGQVPDGKELYPKMQACEYHYYRWLWNLKIWWDWHFKQTLWDWYRKHIRVPIGGLRKPIPLKWISSYDGMADKIIPFGEPECPYCKKMPYSYEQCVFCGQRFIQENPIPDKTAPQRPMKEGETIIFIDGICPECGLSCGNGGYGPLRCRCGWVGKEL